ncbi:MAG TPA: hypothetical protein VEF04_20295, partial [Blastocatellia bacterium]|nr:hypothetical protein [Blastocatellia bacterium]
SIILRRPQKGILYYSPVDARKAILKPLLKRVPIASNNTPDFIIGLLCLLTDIGPYFYGVDANRIRFFPFGERDDHLVYREVHCRSFEWMYRADNIRALKKALHPQDPDSVTKDMAVEWMKKCTVTRPVDMVELPVYCANQINAFKKAWGELLRSRESNVRKRERTELESAILGKPKKRARRDGIKA